MWKPQKPIHHPVLNQTTKKQIMSRCIQLKTVKSFTRSVFCWIPDLCKKESISFIKVSPILGLVELSSSSELFSSTSFLDIWIFCFDSELDWEVKIDFLSSDVMAEFVLKIFCILKVCYPILPNVKVMRQICEEFLQKDPWKFN